jgi:hypothetical protein
MIKDEQERLESVVGRSRKKGRFCCRKREGSFSGEKNSFGKSNRRWQGSLQMKKGTLGKGTLVSVFI